MGSIDDFSELCRLCLVKDQVNIPIFDETSDIGQTFLKIESCLPVKVSRDDNLPKKICDGCSYKLDMLYIFRNTSIDSEKQLISWLSQAGLSTTSKDPLATTTKPEIMVKQETFEPSDTRVDGDSSDLGVDAHSYMMQQQQLPYQQDFDFGEPSSSAARLSDEPSPKRAKRAAALKKAPIEETEEDEEEDLDAAMQITKAEDEDSEDADQPDYVEAPSTSADDQPGPSGVGKGAVEAPSRSKKRLRKGSNPKIDSDEDYKPVVNPKPKKTPRTWTCKKCRGEFSTRRSLSEHKKIHKVQDQDPQSYKYDTNLEVFVCNTCSAEFQEKEEAESHITKCHIETYSCDTCSMHFSNAYNFSCHMQQHNEGGLFRCPMCSYSTPRRTCIMTHINRMHYHKFYYYCTTCGKGFNDGVRFKEHENEHLGLKPFVCVVCAKSFVYSRYLHLHQLRYHTVGIVGQLLKNQCSVCLKVFSRNNTLDRHMASRHSNNLRPKVKRHLCDICGKGFATNDKMKIHYRVHTGIKPYTCQYCNKSFIKRDYLVMHERVHTGEKPYECQYCGKCFNQGAPLRIHIRGHTGERPYICQFCNIGFISKGSLNMHQKVCRGSIN